VVKEELGIKNQAYHIIDSVNNEYLQCNLKLKEQNEKLLAESNRIREEMENLKKRLQPPPLVDLTSEEISDDDEIQFVSATKVEKVIEGVVEINDDDDDDVQIITDCANNVTDNHQGTTQFNESNHEDYGHTIRSIETRDMSELSIPEMTQEIPVKNELIPFLNELGHSVNVILSDNQIAVEKEYIVKTENDAQSIVVTPDVNHLTFGDIPLQNDPQNILSDFEDDEPVFKKYKFEQETDFSFLRDYLSQT
jgi:hypothetical protein